MDSKEQQHVGMEASKPQREAEQSYASHPTPPPPPPPVVVCSQSPQCNPQIQFKAPSEEPPEKKQSLEQIPSSSEDKSKHVQASPLTDTLSHEYLLEKLVAAKADLIPTMGPDDAPGPGVAGQPSQVDEIDLNMLMKFGYMEVRLIIEWARKVPGYRDLCINDQISLLKSSFMDLNVFRLAYRSIGLDNSFKFAHNLILSEERCKNMGWGLDLNIYMRSMVGKMETIRIDVAEFCLLNAIIFTYPDAEGLESRITVMNLQSRILQCFHKYCLDTYPDQPTRYTKMLLWLPTLRHVSHVATDKFLNMSIAGSITMNALILELLT